MCECRELLMTSASNGLCFFSWGDVVLRASPIQLPGSVKRNRRVAAVAAVVHVCPSPFGRQIVIQLPRISNASYSDPTRVRSQPRRPHLR